MDAGSHRAGSVVERLIEHLVEPATVVFSHLLKRRFAVYRESPSDFIVDTLERLKFTLGSSASRFPRFEVERTPVFCVRSLAVVATERTSNPASREIPPPRAVSAAFPALAEWISGAVDSNTNIDVNCNQYHLESYRISD
jgi:hypothetical protein